MNMKTTLLALVAVALSTAFAKGIYFVSGGDFRECSIRFIMQTTEPNETVEITPGMVVLLNNYPTGNQAFVGGWSLKTMGQEFIYGPYDNIRFTNGKAGCTNAAPIQFTYPTPGRHLVKMYNPKGNVYMLHLTNNQHLVSATIDWENAPFAQKHSGNAEVMVSSCTNLQQLTIRHPIGPYLAKLSGLRYMPKLESVTLSNPQMYNRIDIETGREGVFTNDLVFVNVTNISARAFIHAYKVNYVSIPKVISIGTQAFNQTKKSKTDLQNNNWGIRRLRIGDKLQNWGTNSFWGQDMLDEIEFVTESEDWI